MSLSAKQAAELVGLSKPGLIKAIRQGKVSAEKDIKGEWRIEAVELFRVYPAISQEGDKPEEASLSPSKQENTASLEAELRHLQERLADREDVIADLRQRLDAEANERRQLTLILTDKSQTAETPKSWWSRLLG